MASGDGGDGGAVKAWVRSPWLALGLIVLAAWGAQQWWRSAHQQQLGQQVAALVRAGDIRMLSSESCGICTVARGWFAQNGVVFSECFIERDTACRNEFEALRAAGTPVLLVRGQPQLGFNPQRLLKALQQG
jgi:hypothetical protein